MKPSTALKDKEDLVRKVIESYGFTSPRIFGSTAKKQDSDSSDLDILVSVAESSKGKITLFTISRMKNKLEELLGVDIDINIDENIPEHIRRDIEEHSFGL